MFRTFHRILIAAGLMLAAHPALAENRADDTFEPGDYRWRPTGIGAFCLILKTTQ
jgi:hypothetical protein